MARPTRRTRLAPPLAALLVAAVSACITSSNTPPPAVDAGNFSFDASPGIDVSVAPDTGTAAEAGSNLDATAGGDGSSGGCSAGWVLGADGVCYVSLLGSWSPATDANSDGPDTVANLGTVTATSASVVQAHTGTDYADCGCNAQHLNVPLGRSFPCATSTLEFSYATTATKGPTNNPAVDIRFCTGPCPSVDGGAGGPYFYTGPQYAGSPFAPASSSCGYEWENDAGTASLNAFPASAAIATGKNTIPLGAYAAPASGDACTGTFDTLDVHLQTYNCAAADTGTSTLSNLRVF